MLAKKKLATRKKAPSLRRSAPKPWELAGMSRTSWYRAGKPGSGVRIKDLPRGHSQPASDPGILERTREQAEAEQRGRYMNAEIERRVAAGVARAVHEDRVASALAWLRRTLDGKKPTDIITFTGTAAQFASVALALETAGHGRGE